MLSGLPAGIDLTALARETGAIQRCRRIADGETLVKLALWYGPGHQSLRSTTALSSAVHLADLSDVALYKRLARTGPLLEALITPILAARQPEIATVNRRLVLIDGTAVRYPGSNGAAFVLHSRYDPTRGFTGFELTHDHGGEKLVRHPINPSEVIVADRAYGRIKGLRHVLDNKADFVVRISWRALALRAADGQAFDLLGALEGLAPGQTRELTAYVPHDSGLMPLRLVVQAKDAAAEAAERRRVARKARKQGRASNPNSQRAARYMIIATSLTEETCPTAEVLLLYRIRWQIELAFKRLKSLLHLDRLPARNPGLARTWINAHLLLALLIDTMTQQVLASPSCAEITKTRQPSLWRINQIFLTALIASLFNGIGTAFTELGDLLKRLFEPPRKRKLQTLNLSSAVLS